MSKRTLHDMVKVGPLGLALALAPLAIACGGSAERSPNEPNCHAEDSFEFSTPLIDAEEGSPNHPGTWFGATDNTPNCLAGVVDGMPVGDLKMNDAGFPVIKSSVCKIRENATPQVIFPDDPAFASTTETSVFRSLVFHSNGCTFWGSNASHTPTSTLLTPGLVGNCAFYSQGSLAQQSGYWDGSDAEGIAFWARTPGPSNHSVLLTLNNADTESQAQAAWCYEERQPRTRCTPAPSDATAGLGLAVVDFQSGTATAGGVPARIPQPGECGNAYQTALITTPDWQLYTLPFSEFYQLPYPNRIASGMDTTTLMQIGVIFPREVRTELWIANIRFFRHKGTHAVQAADGGTN